MQANPEETSAYFSELLSYSLDRLAKEPELLRADQEQLRRQLQDTAVGHYRSFIGSQRCLGELQAQLRAATAHLDDLARDLPKLQAVCDRFRQDAAAIAGKRAEHRQLYGEAGWGMAGRLRAALPTWPRVLGAACEMLMPISAQLHQLWSMPACQAGTFAMSRCVHPLAASLPASPPCPLQARTRLSWRFWRCRS